MNLLFKNNQFAKGSLEVRRYELEMMVWFESGTCDLVDLVRGGVCLLPDP